MSAERAQTPQGAARGMEPLGGASGASQVSAKLGGAPSGGAAKAAGEIRETVERLHGVYCRMTRQTRVSLRFDTQRLWHEWVKCGWTEADLRGVIRYIQVQIGVQKRNDGALRLRNLLEPSQFEGDLGLAERAGYVRSPAACTVQAPPPPAPPGQALTPEQMADIRRKHGIGEGA